MTFPSDSPLLPTAREEPCLCGHPMCERCFPNGCITQAPREDYDKRGIPVRICSESHPHYDEKGWLTGEYVLVLGQRMALVNLANCRHGTSGCYIKPGEVERVRA